jgi:WD40 repeat protein
VYSVAISGDVCVSGSRDKTVRVWDVRNERLMHVLEGHSDQVESVAVSADGSTIRSISMGEAFFWSVQTGERLADDVAAAFVEENIRPEGQRRRITGPVVGLGRDTTVGATIDSSVYAVRMSVVGNGRIVCGCALNTVVIWQVR